MKERPPAVHPRAPAAKSCCGAWLLASFRCPLPRASILPKRRTLAPLQTRRRQPALGITPEKKRRHLDDDGYLCLLSHRHKPPPARVAQPKGPSRTSTLGVSPLLHFPAPPLRCLRRYKFLPALKDVRPIPCAIRPRMAA